MSTAEEPKLDEAIAERFQLKALVEACLVLEEGIAGVREIDLGPDARHRHGSRARSRAPTSAGSTTCSPRSSAPRPTGASTSRRRSCCAGSSPRAAWARRAARASTRTRSPSRATRHAVVKLDRRDDVAILWLDNPPANSIAPAVIEALDTAWSAVEGEVGAVILASPNPTLFCAGADIKSFTSMDEAAGRELTDRMHALLRRMESSRTMTIAAVNGLALGGGCELAMACDVRLAAFSASFGQPEINLGIIPGFGGTQRLPRLVGPAKALEMNTTGDPISAEEAFEFGLVNRVVADHELFDTALAWARKFAGQAPVALEQIKRVSHAGDLDEGIAAEKDAFAAVFATEDAREGISAFLGKRTARFKGA